MDRIGSGVSSTLDATQAAGSKQAKAAALVSETVVNEANRGVGFTRQQLGQWRNRLEQLPRRPTRLISLVANELDQLDLSPEQQVAVTPVIARTVTHLQTVAEHIEPGDDGASIAEHLETAAIQEIDALLTPAQREKRTQMIADLAQPSGR